METLKFKTTIKCTGCLAKVSPFLNQTAGEDNWEVDLQSPEKILMVNSDQDLSESEIITAVQQAGYKIEKL